MRRIINNKRIDLTDDEWELYQSICRSYDRPNFKGESLFVDLFETDSDGIITFLKPPAKNFTTMEVFLFMMSILCHQHLRVMHTKVDESIKEMKSELALKKDELDQAISEAKNSRAS